jgi:hypothetical protein
MRSSRIRAECDAGKELGRVRGSVRQAGTIGGMCRSIKRLREGDVPATETEIREAALQFVRKVSGYRAPSKRNEEAFNGAVDEVADASRRLLEAVTRSGSA